MTAPGQAAPTSALLEQLREKARLLRIHSLRMTTAAGSGHPTSCLSAAELVAATFFYAMKLDVANPNSVGSDRFVLIRILGFSACYPLFNRFNGCGDSPPDIFTRCNASSTEHTQYECAGD